MTLWHIIGVVLAAILGFSYATNPFNRFTIVRRSYRVAMTDNVMRVIDENHKLVVSRGRIEKILAIINNGVYIVWSRWHTRPTSDRQTIEETIDDIYRLRFNPNKLLLTSGDHFSSLFVRNLGVFYYPVLDTHLPSSEERWQARQITYLQTLAYALGVFAKADTLTTTIVPTGRYRATCVNFHAYPSDTLYGMLYVLSALLGKQKARPYVYGAPVHPHDTIDAATALYETYSDSLRSHYNNYRAMAFDELSGLISTSVKMSGAKDITMRESAFYDNVIFWKTTELAMVLGLIDHDGAFLDTLKMRIIDAFWLEDEGYFLEDLSTEGVNKKYYSSDWLIVLATGFISPSHQDERTYFERSCAYIKSTNIARPFAIKYQQDTRAHRQFPIVRLAVASYSGDSIWSFWGMEYIKTNLALYRETGENSYLVEADYHIDAYKEKMLQYGGYPETYDAKGNLLETPFYRSIIQTGWVIGFEQVMAIRDNISA